MNDLFKDQTAVGGPVECMGQTFPNDEERREHFLKLLEEKLKDPVFRKQEGFPKGTDEAILAMSDPPYYTACPNPWLADFVSAVQEALSGLEKIGVSGDDIKKALLQGGSPATPDDLRKRFETFLNDRCRGKDASKLRFVVE